MSLDITVYQDKELEISANVGSWGARLYFTPIDEQGNPTKSEYTFLTSGLLVVMKLDEFIFRIQKIRDQLAGDYSFDIIRDLKDYGTIDFSEKSSEEKC